MTQPTHTLDQQPETPKRAILGSVAGGWLLGMGALAYATLPASASLTSGQFQETAGIKTPVITSSQIPQARQSVPASAVTQADPAPRGDLSLIRENEMVDFIVRFENDIDALDACSQMFRQDKEEAQKMFADWAAEHEAMQGMRLKKVSYSGEMILTWDTGSAQPLLRKSVEEKLAKIKALPSVRYADPDHTAQAQGAR